MRWLSSDTMLHKKKVRSSSIKSDFGLVGFNSGECLGGALEIELCAESSGGGSYRSILVTASHCFLIACTLGLTEESGSSLLRGPMSCTTFDCE